MGSRYYYQSGREDLHYEAKKFADARMAELAPDYYQIFWTGFVFGYVVIYVWRGDEIIEVARYPIELR